MVLFGIANTFVIIELCAHSSNAMTMSGRSGWFQRDGAGGEGSFLDLCGSGRSSHFGWRCPLFIAPFYDAESSIKSSIIDHHRIDAIEEDDEDDATRTMKKSVTSYHYLSGSTTAA